MAARSGQITVTTAGTAVQGPDLEVAVHAPFQLKAHPDNAGVIWVGNDGSSDVSSTTGFPLQPGETMIVTPRNLNAIWVDAAISGEKLCWFQV